MPPAYGHRNYDPEVARWAEAVERADGYLVITSEYNHGYPAVLKNAFDHIFPEWNRKPISFVGYGNSGGARAIEQLRLVAIELELDVAARDLAWWSEALALARAADQ